MDFVSEQASSTLTRTAQLPKILADVQLTRLYNACRPCHSCLGAAAGQIVPCSYGNPIRPLSSYTPDMLHFHVRLLSCQSTATGRPVRPHACAISSSICALLRYRHTGSAVMQVIRTCCILHPMAAFLCVSREDSASTAKRNATARTNMCGVTAESWHGYLGELE